MVVNFTKMHGLGNDFMVVDMISQHVHLRPEQIKRLSDRNLGIGFDQLLLVEPPGSPGVDFRYRIFNADGSEVEQCGNGARCFAIFVREKKLTNKNHILVETSKGVIELHIDQNNRVLVDMGKPVFSPKDVPFISDIESPSYTLDVSGQNIQLSVASMGNPHAVIELPELTDKIVNELGPVLECHEAFPEKVNVGFMEIIHKHFIKLRVYERGVGETLACGTGACAAVACGILRGVLESPVEVKLPGGNLKIEWDGPGHSLMMEGPATSVFEGKIRI
jgi:diaminopimelate epimerase|tara:strand:+ start:1355 stop:2185 length:831 start_codon:yes stop_codon:yes gene_type:complete